MQELKVAQFFYNWSKLATKVVGFNLMIFFEVAEKVTKYTKNTED